MSEENDLAPLTPEEEADADKMERLIARIIRVRRHAFYDDAVRIGIITPEQKTNLMVLHTLRDTQQKVNDRE